MGVILILHRVPVLLREGEGRGRKGSGGRREGRERGEERKGGADKRRGEKRLGYLTSSYTTFFNPKLLSTVHGE
jgi:hypothetical protein